MIQNSGRDEAFKGLALRRLAKLQRSVGTCTISEAMVVLVEMRKMHFVVAVPLLTLKLSIKFALAT